MSTTTQIFSEYQLNTQLRKYINDEINFCDERIRECKFILTSDSEDVLPEDRVHAHRKLEVINFRRFWLLEQLDNIPHISDYIGRNDS